MTHVSNMFMCKVMFSLIHCNLFSTAGTYWKTVTFPTGRGSSSSGFRHLLYELYIHRANPTWFGWQVTTLPLPMLSQWKWLFKTFHKCQDVDLIRVHEGNSAVNIWLAEQNWTSCARQLGMNTCAFIKNSISLLFSPLLTWGWSWAYL